MKVYLVRHTTPLIEKSYCYGQTDVGLSATFKSEFLKLNYYIPAELDAVYTSPLQRCSLLAAEIMKINKVPLFTDERLKEMNFGKWENKTWDELDQEELSCWMADFVNVTTPMGESFNDLYVRVLDFIRTVIYPSPHRTILIVTHAGVIRCFLNFILNFPLNNAFKLKIDLGSVTLITINPQSDYDVVDFFNKSEK